MNEDDGMWLELDERFEALNIHLADDVTPRACDDGHVPVGVDIKGTTLREGFLKRRDLA